MGSTRNRNNDDLSEGVEFYYDVIRFVGFSWRQFVKRVTTFPMNKFKFE